MQRSFRIFAAKEDLENIFTMLQQEDHIYYVPTYSDHQNGRINDILSVPGFGINTTGRKIGNHQFLIFYQESKCHWREIGGSRLYGNLFQCIGYCGGGFDHSNFVLFYAGTR